MRTTYATPHFSASDSLHELATIFATGVERLKSRRPQPAEISPRLSDSTGDCLELSATNRLTVPRG